jgi:hypothetical protein
VGERFGLLLTCSVIETGPITVVPVLNQLEPGALSITPFEVVSGVSHDDVVVAPWRYIQREYAVRLLSDGFFGQDVTIPALTVTYNLQERGSGSQGRDQTYILPALPMRILSLVPKSADDIRDASGQTFASIESRRFRASLATTTAWIAFAFATLFGIFALVRAARQLGVKNRGVVKPLPASSLLGASLTALARVKDDASQADGRRSCRAARPPRYASPAAALGVQSPGIVGPEVTGGTPGRTAAGPVAADAVGAHDARTITTGLSNGHGPNGKSHRANPRVDLRRARRSPRPGAAVRKRTCQRSADGTQAVRASARRRVALDAPRRRCAHLSALMPTGRPASRASPRGMWWSARAGATAVRAGATALLVFIVPLAIAVLLLGSVFVRQRTDGRAAGRFPVAAFAANGAALRPHSSRVFCFRCRPRRPVDRVRARSLVSGPADRAAHRRIHEHGDPVRVHGERQGEGDVLYGGGGRRAVHSPP